MKNTICTLVLLLNGMLSASLAKADCPANKVYACRYDSCGIIECKCVSPAQLQNWLATTPACSNKNWWHPHCCNGFRMSPNQAGAQINIHPNPVSTSATVSFSIQEAQNVSIMVYDMSGRLVAAISNEFYESGNQQVVWNTDAVNAGIYFLQFQSHEFQERIKVVVTK
jgi:hypothetical protein